MDRILSLHSTEWVIRALVKRDDFSPEEHDRLEARLLATLDSLDSGDGDILETALIATELLDTVDRPVDRDRFRERVHTWLQEFHSTHGGGFQVSGGFKEYLNLRVGSVGATWNAIRLMEIYGVPSDLDINWVRSFLRPLTSRQLDDQKWIAAVARDKLDHLPGVKPPAWIEIIYYERGLVTAVILVMLCVCVTISIPRSGTSSSRPS